MKEKKTRVEDAMHATRAAQPGRHPARRRRRPAAGRDGPEGREDLTRRREGRLQHRRPGLPVADQADRRERRRGRRRRRQQGAGQQGRRTSATTPAPDEYCDMVKEGIIDPTKVVRSALQNAASVATLLLTSDALVAESRRRTRRRAAAAAATTTCTEKCECGCECEKTAARLLLASNRAARIVRGTQSAVRFT